MGDEADETDAPAETEEPETVELRRNLRNRNRPTREPLAEGETREPRGTKEPCEGEDCERRQRRREGRDRRGRDSDSTKEPCDRDEADETDAPAETEEPETVELRRNLRNRNRRPRRRRDGDETTAAPTEDDIVVRRMLRRGGRRGRGLDAVISGGSVEIAGIVGTVEFGEVSQELESIPLTLTIGETIFTCDVEVRRDGVSCRASSEDNFKVRVGCAIPAEPEL